MPERPTDNALNRLLRAGDPAAGEPGLGAAERTAMRRRMLAAGNGRRGRISGWLAPAMTATALLALALGLAWRGPQSATLGTAELPEPVRSAAAAGDPGQQVQFTTEGGTLVVWVLRPQSSG